MPSGREMSIGRRQFVSELAFGAFVAATFSSTGDAAAQPEDKPNIHNMLLVGEKTVFLSHLPMFIGLNESETAFVSPHRFQVIVEAGFTNKGNDVTELYLKDRAAHPDIRLYTLGPDPMVPFVLTRLFTPREKPALPAFNATAFRFHLESKERQPIPGLVNTAVQVKRIVHGRMFDPKTTKPTALEYLLFGTGSELYLAHAIFAPPDFDQVLAVKVTGVELDAKQLAGDLRVTIPSRKNVVAERLREKERVEAALRIGSTSSPVQLETGAQFYFEEGELLVPHTFEPTPEEKKK
jgi:hypothetical protein